MWDSVINFDEVFFLFINSRHSLFWDFFMKIVTGKIIWGFFYFSILYALWKTFGLRGMLLIFVATCFVVLIADQFTVSLLRPIFGRLRPSQPDNPISSYVHLVNDYRAGLYGFPSAHAANTLGVATFLSLVFRRWRFTIAIYLWSFLNAYSRVYLGVHYPGDLLVGGIIGIIAGLFVYFMILLLLKNISVYNDTTTILLRNKKRGHNEITYEFRPSDVPIIIEFLTLIGISLVSLFYLII